MFEKQILSFLNNEERISYSNFKDNYQNQLLIKKIKGILKRILYLTGCDFLIPTELN